MRSHSRYKDLRKAILDKAKESMKTNVLPEVKGKMSEAIKEEVYDVYEPKRYIRRGKVGGLHDESLIKGHVISRANSDGFDYKVVNTAKTNFGGRPQTYLTPLVVMGQLRSIAAGYGSQYLYYEDSEYKPYGQERDFITATVNKLDRRDLADLLKNGMR